MDPETSHTYKCVVFNNKNYSGQEGWKTSPSMKETAHMIVDGTREQKRRDIDIVGKIQWSLWIGP